MTTEARCDTPIVVRWDQGPRKTQEDYYGVWGTGRRVLLTVSDGMGGHAKGEFASRWMVEELTKTFKKKGIQVPQVFTEATDAVIKKMKALQDVMGCTFVAAVIEKEAGKHKVTFTWLGDSRIYVRSAHTPPVPHAIEVAADKTHKLWLVTSDDSFIWGFYSRKEMSLDQVTQHPYKNQLEYSVHLYMPNASEIVVKRIYTMTLEPGDKIMLCSDGVWESFENQADILACMSDDAAKANLEDHLVKAFKLGKCNDNNTFILATIGDHDLFNWICLPDEKCLPELQRLLPAE